MQRLKQIDRRFAQVYVHVGGMAWLAANAWYAYPVHNATETVYVLMLLVFTINPIVCGAAGAAYGSGMLKSPLVIWPAAVFLSWFVAPIAFFEFVADSPGSAWTHFLRVLSRSGISTTVYGVFCAAVFASFAVVHKRLPSNAGAHEA